MYKRSFKDYFGRNRKALYMILGILLVSVFSLTIVYAALSVTLNIAGNAEVVASTWDIHLDNVKVTSGSVSGTTPSITTPTTATFSTTLTIPGDFYEFTVDVVNAGSIDAMINSVTKEPILTEAQAKYLNYIVEYQNGESINTKQLVSKNSFVRLKVRVEFRKDITASDLPITSETLNLAFTVNYVQSDGQTGIIVPGKSIIKIVSGDGTNTSDEICIGKECFYVMYSDEESITMLAKYNLYVGGVYNSGWTAYGDEATGKQDSTMLGLVSGQSISNGTTAFSNTNSTYEGSIVEGYVNNYKTILESEYGVDVVEARLITKDELTNSETFACPEYDYCSDKYPWIYSTSYWSGSAYNSRNVWRVSSDGNFHINYCDSDDRFGVRPVIVISRDLIDGAGSSATKQLIEFTIDGTTYQAEEGMTWGEWVESEYNTIDLSFNDFGYVWNGDNELKQCVSSSDVIHSSELYNFVTVGLGCLPPGWN